MSLFSQPAPSRPSHRTGRDPLAQLTDRERDVLALMADGWSNPAIARRLHVVPGTVEKHIRSIYLKLELGAGEQGHRRVLAVLTYLNREHPPFNNRIANAPSF